VTHSKNQDFFEDLQTLINGLEHEGRADAVAELRDGLGSLNGLTDGWAALMESMERVLSTTRLSPSQQHELAALHASVQKIVFRR
jgi:hypothetical protein